MQVSRQYLESLGCFKPIKQKHVVLMANAVSDEVPSLMATLIAVNTLSHYISGFRNLIELNEGSSTKTTLVPTGSFAFFLGYSGLSKDKTLNAFRSMLQGGYNVQDRIVHVDNVEKAKFISIKETGDEEAYKKYLVKPFHQRVKFGTTQGVNQAISDIGNKQQVGSPIVTSSEIGSDLSNRGGSVVSTFTTLSDGFDIGNLEFDSVRSKEAKIDGVTNLPISLMVFGSEQGILLDPSVKLQFKSVFSQQFARRCIFCFINKVQSSVLPDTIAERIALNKANKKKIGANQDKVYSDITMLAEQMTIGNNIKIDPEVDDIFGIYLTYNNLVAESIHKSLPISKLSRQHKQWLALKLAGVYAMLDKPKNLTILPKHYIEAINTIEELSSTLPEFERELAKEPHEMLYDYCVDMNEPKVIISFHELKKLKFVEGSGTKTKVNELVTLLNSYSDDIFTVNDTSLVFERTEVVEATGISVIEIDTSSISEASTGNLGKVEVSKAKAIVSSNTVHGYEYLNTVFPDYATLLGGDTTYAYSPFKFKTVEDGATYDKKLHTNPTGGIRGKDNIVGGCSFLVLDIDKSAISDEEAHFLLNDINHHIARTSDANNKFKFRLLIDIDRVVNIDGITWKYFMEEIARELGLQIDPVSQSQPFLTYSSKEVLSITDADPMDIKDALIRASERREAKVVPKLTSKEVAHRLEDKFGTFGYAFNTSEGGRNNALIRVLYDAKDLGASKEYTKDLLIEINDYLVFPLTEEELNKYLLCQVDRW